MHGITKEKIHTAKTALPDTTLGIPRSKMNHRSERKTAMQFVSATSRISRRTDESDTAR